MEVPFTLDRRHFLPYMDTFPVDHSLHKRAGLSGILGSLTCPSVVNGTNNVEAELADDDDSPDPDDVTSEMLRRAFDDEIGIGMTCHTLK